MNISLDIWDGNKCQIEEKYLPDALKCIELLEKLDGKKHTMLSLTSEGKNLVIGGGGGAYIISQMDDLGNSVSLQNPNGRENNLIELCAGGQVGEFPENIVCSKILAHAAIHEFFSGNKNPVLIWKEER